MAQSYPPSQRHKAIPLPNKKNKKQKPFPHPNGQSYSPSPTTTKKVKKTFPLPNDTTLFPSSKCTRPINSLGLLYCTRLRIATLCCLQPKFHYAAYRPEKRPKKNPRNELHCRFVPRSSTSFRAPYSMGTPRGALFSPVPMASVALKMRQSVVLHHSF